MAFIKKKATCLKLSSLDTEQIHLFPLYFAYRMNNITQVKMEINIQIVAFCYTTGPVL